MCIICISDKGIKQPNKDTMFRMWQSNPHGAGFMYYRDGSVFVDKGYMKFADFWQAVQDRHFTKNDVVVYHFRISTQGGVNPEMTQPFYYTKDISKTKLMHAETKLGICHNGIIPMTSNGDTEYSDTAYFVADYLPLIIRNTNDLRNIHALELLGEVLHSKMVFLDCKGRITRVGKFVREPDGLVYSNETYKPRKYYYTNSFLMGDDYLYVD